MCVRRSMLCTAICTGILMLGLGMIQHGVAEDKDREFLPVVDGPILDQSPFDGVGDGVDEDLAANPVTLNSGISESRAAMEFDLSAIDPHRIRSAFLKIVPSSKAFLPGTSIIPVQLFGYYGDGSLQTDDFNVGCFITVFDGLAAPFGVPISLDVTEFLRGVQRPQKLVVGFSLRTNVHGAQFVFLSSESLELGSPPTLVVTLK